MKNSIYSLHWHDKFAIFHALKIRWILRVILSIACGVWGRRWGKWSLLFLPPYDILSLKKWAKFVCVSQKQSNNFISFFLNLFKCSFVFPGEINWQNCWLQKYNHLKIKWLPTLFMIVMRESLYNKNTKTYRVICQIHFSSIFRVYPNSYCERIVKLHSPRIPSDSLNLKIWILENYGI